MPKCDLIFSGNYKNCMWDIFVFDLCKTFYIYFAETRKISNVTRLNNSHKRLIIHFALATMGRMTAMNLKSHVDISVYLHDVSKPVMKFGQGAYTVDPARVLGQQDHPSNVSRQYGSEIEIWV